MPCESSSLRNAFINLTSIEQVRVEPQGAGSQLVNFHFIASFLRILVSEEIFGLGKCTGNQGNRLRENGLKRVVW